MPRLPVRQPDRLRTCRATRRPAGADAQHRRFLRQRVPAVRAETKRKVTAVRVSLDVMNHIEALAAAGVKALKIEGRQRGKAYVAEVVRRLKDALNSIPADRARHVEGLRRLSEGQRTTAGAYEKKWR